VLKLETIQPHAPRTRGECINGPRPCPWLDCRYHLHRVGDFAKAADTETCSLDVADRGEHTLADVAKITGLSVEWIRQIELGALEQLDLPELKKHVERSERPLGNSV
jgi:hypothetical protein